jgi:hypothetical protein
MTWCFPHPCYKLLNGGQRLWKRNWKCWRSSKPQKPHGCTRIVVLYHYYNQEHSFCVWKDVMQIKASFINLSSAGQASCLFTTWHLVVAFMQFLTKHVAHTSALQLRCRNQRQDVHSFILGATTLYEHDLLNNWFFSLMSISSSQCFNGAGHTHNPHLGGPELLCLLPRTAFVTATGFLPAFS